MQTKISFTDYEGFVEKFKPKKTTDDCYTPPEVYDVVIKWVGENIMQLGGKRIVRPFRPGGDYQAEDYSGDCVVVDNPPFSILAQIRRWYQEHNVKYFLFAPGLTLFSCDIPKETLVVVSVSVAYANGAKIDTSFVTNMLDGNPRVIVAGDLHTRLAGIAKSQAETKKREYPMECITSATLGRLSRRGICLSIPADECHYVSKLDGMGGGRLYGSGFLISERAVAERAAAERAAAERAAAERAAAERILLSPREKKIVARLSKKDENNGDCSL